MRDELISVVHSDIDRGSTFGHDPIKGRDHPLSVDGTINEGCRALIDDVEEFEDLATLGLIELKVHGPGNVSSYGLMSTHGDPMTCPSVLACGV